MDKAAIRAKARKLVTGMWRGQYVTDQNTDIAEASLTQVHNEAVEAAAKAFGPDIRIGREQVEDIRNKIRRVRIEEGE